MVESFRLQPRHNQNNITLLCSQINNNIFNSEYVDELKLRFEKPEIR